MNTLIEKVIQFKDLYKKSIEQGLDTSEIEIYNNLFYYLKYEKYKNIMDFNLDIVSANTTPTLIIEELPKVEEIITPEELTDLYDEMELQIKIIHQKFINEGELDVDDVLLYDSIYPELKKNGFYVDKYKIR